MNPGPTGTDRPNAPVPGAVQLKRPSLQKPYVLDSKGAIMILNFFYFGQKPVPEAVEPGAKQTTKKLPAQKNESTEQSQLVRTLLEKVVLDELGNVPQKPKSLSALLDLVEVAIEEHTHFIANILRRETILGMWAPFELAISRRIEADNSLFSRIADFSAHSVLGPDFIQPKEQDVVRTLSNYLNGGVKEVKAAADDLTFMVQIVHDQWFHQLISRKVHAEHAYAQYHGSDGYTDILLPKGAAEEVLGGIDGYINRIVHAIEHYARMVIEAPPEHMTHINDTPGLAETGERLPREELVGESGQAGGKKGSNGGDIQIN